MSHRAALVSGTLFALAAGLMWGLIFVAPLLLAAYPPAMLSVGRYLAFGLIALPLAWLDRARIRELTRADWADALRLALVGNLLYYLLLSSAIQRAGGPLPTMIIGTLPLVIAVASNRRNRHRDGLLSWRQLAPSLLLIAAGLALVNRAELAQLAPDADRGRYALGALLAVGAMACWTWYPIRNADWLRAHPDRSPSTWATAQGLATLPLAALGALMLVVAGAAGLLPLDGGPLGPTPWRFVGVMLVVALLCSWLGTLCWNEASQRLPTTLAGQLIVFESLAGMAYAFLLRGQWPPADTLAGIALLIAGVAWALRAKPQPVPAAV